MDHRRAGLSSRPARPGEPRSDGAESFQAVGPMASLVAGGDLAERIAGRIRAEIGTQRFAASFAHKAVFQIEAGVVNVVTPNKVLAGLLERRFGDMIRAAVQTECSSSTVLKFVVAPELFGPTADPAEPTPEVSSPASLIESKPTPKLRLANETRRSVARVQVNERYRLENFLVGESNRLAYTAAMRMAEGTPEAAGMSPLFIHGSCGVGKTHILAGLAIRYRETHPGAVVRVAAAETFMNEYIAAVRAGDVEKFRRAYRRVDLLCIDDVHFLANKQSTQGELLHTLDELQRAGARIVLASDEHPRTIKQFSAALTSRFMAGMVAMVSAPDQALREQCVRSFARSRGLNLDESAVARLVQHTAPLPGQPAASIRDIEGLVTRIDAVHRLMPEYAGNTPGVISLALVERALGHATPIGSGSAAPDTDNLPPLDGQASARSTRPIRIESVIEQTCTAMAVEKGDLAGKTRHPRVVLARALITHLARQLTTLSFPDIARAIGRPNHSTVITAFQRLAKQLEADEAVEAPGAPEATTLAVLVRQIGQSVQLAARRER